MISRLIAAIWQAIINMTTVGGKATASFLDWVLSLPGRMLGGSQPSLPPTPDTPDIDVAEEFEEARKKAANKLVKSDIELVRDFLKTHKTERTTKKLPKTLPPHVKEALLTLPEEAVMVLSRVEEGYLRRYLKGGLHAIGGVPEFQNVYTASDKLPTEEDVMKFNVKRAFQKRREADKHRKPVRL